MASILLIDDDENILTVMQIGLQQAGYQVETAQNGEEGMRLLKRKSEEIDLIVTDIIMPDSEGIGTILELRRNYSGIPVIAVSGGSGNSTMNFLEMAKKLGAAATLQKPFTPRQLAALIEQHLSANGSRIQTAG
jgi:DNA-binding response OmpR family regulator